MPSNPSRSGLFLVQRPQPRIVGPCPAQLRCIDRKIADSLLSEPYRQARDVFALAANFAGEAIDAANALQQIPGSLPSVALRQDSRSDPLQARDAIHSAAAIE